MPTCLVLGGAGFIGSHLTHALARAGHRVRAFDRPHVDSLAELAGRGDCEIVTGDFLNPKDLALALAGSEIVFHLVSTTLPQASNENPSYDVETNLLGTLRLLELCRRERVRKVVFISSGGTVYGVPRTVPIAESHPTQPTCAYGIHKLAIEKYLHLEHLLHGLDYCVLRPANLYGERQRPGASLLVRGEEVAQLRLPLVGQVVEVGAAVDDLPEVLRRDRQHLVADRTQPLGRFGRHVVVDAPRARLLIVGEPSTQIVAFSLDAVFRANQKQREIGRKLPKILIASRNRAALKANRLRGSHCA